MSEKRLSFEDAVKKYKHELGGICPITKKPITDDMNIYTDHSRGGFDGGKFRIVMFNSCAHCNKPFNVAKELHRLNEERKAQVEGVE